MKSYLEIVANLLHDVKQAVHKVAQIPSFSNTVKHHFDMVADCLKQQLMAKLFEIPCFALQFDKTTDIKNDAEVILCSYFPDKSKKIV